MKCFVLAGGSSDRLWPLSRKNYPKQFMEIRDHRSMFQETILRNIPFCDESVILANRRYESILRGQLRAFQRLNCSFLFEEQPVKTAFPITVALLRCKPEEEILIVSTDVILDGDYNGTVTDLKKIVAQDRVGVVGAAVMNKWDGYSYISYSGKDVTGFSSVRPEEGYYLWDCGIVAGRARVLLDALDDRYLLRCRRRMEMFNGVITREMATGMPPYALGQVLHPERASLIRARFRFHRIVDLKTFSDYKGKREQDSFSLKVLCRNTDVVNTEEDKAIVLNNVEDLIVVNTRDALYISKKESVADIKQITSLNYEKNPDIFDRSDVMYYTWGVRQVLYRTGGYKVNKVTVYPHKEIPTHAHTRHSATFSVVTGTAFITVNGEEKEVFLNQSVYVPIGGKHRVENRGELNLTLIETVLGVGIAMDDTVRSLDEVLVKLSPALRECIWGGVNLSKVLGKKLYGKKKVGESWELSTHPGGESVVADGKYAGKTLKQFIEIIGREKLGWKCQAFSEFPLLIKFIDAHRSLSIQVHPSDEYAFPHENEYGKNELWYVVDAKPDAYIYAGFNRNVTRSEVLRRIHDGSLEEILQKIPVKAGQTYFLHTGMVHAIGVGCIICEIQQSSNVTYRLYDYDRKNERGEPRELHIEKALDVLNYKSSLREFVQRDRSEPYGNGTRTLLGDCKYFSASKYDAKGEISIAVDYSSFCAFVVLEGRGKVVAGDGVSVKTFKRGETFFGVAHKYVFRSKGKISLIAVTL